MMAQNETNYTAAVLTASDKGAAGERKDESGPLLAKMLADAGFAVVAEVIVPDDKGAISGQLKAWSSGDAVDLVLTTGGTGLSPRDVTPEATLAVADRLVPGIAEGMRQNSLTITPRAMLSRAAAVIRGKTLIINLPGSPRACMEGMDVFLDQLPHALDLLRGMPQDCGR